MAISYNKLWKLLIDKGMTKTQMRFKADISTTTLAKLGKNETVSMEVLLKICKVLDCNVGDIMDVINEEAWSWEPKTDLLLTNPSFKEKMNIDYIDNVKATQQWSVIRYRSTVTASVILLCSNAK